LQEGNGDINYSGWNEGVPVMTKLNFQAMTREQLRTYVLENRDHNEAFQAYMTKLADEPVLATESAEETEKLIELIGQKRQMKN
jgi:hypothetical protein